MLLWYFSSLICHPCPKQWAVALQESELNSGLTHSVVDICYSWTSIRDCLSSTLCGSGVNVKQWILQGQSCEPSQANHTLALSWKFWLAQKLTCDSSMPMRPFSGILYSWLEEKSLFFFFRVYLGWKPVLSVTMLFPTSLPWPPVTLKILSAVGEFKTH